MAETETTAKPVEITIPALRMRSIKVGLIGVSGLYCHRMASKAKKTLLIGGRKKTAAEKLNIKHDPYAEFRDSMHIDRDADERTAVFFPAMAIKGAMANAALEVPGIRKAQVHRLVYLPQERVPIYGIPRLRCDVTRSADIAKTPDIRTRAYFPEWATELEIQFLSPTMSQKTVLKLLDYAGQIVGIGDFRQEKGKGAYGCFRLAESNPDTVADFARVSGIAKSAQVSAIDNPVPDNAEAVEMLSMFDAAVEDLS